MCKAGSLGWVWNPITGCLNGCEYCYARKMAYGRLFSRYMSNTNYPSHHFTGVDAINVLDPFYPRFWEDRCNRKGMVGKGKPDRKGIFVCDMSGLFGIGIPEEWTKRVLAICKAMTHHRFYLLTKQPQNLIKFSPFPDNCWVGVTSTNQQQFDKAVKYLKEVKATVKYISFEPLLERINIA